MRCSRSAADRLALELPAKQPDVGRTALRFPARDRQRRRAGDRLVAQHGDEAVAPDAERGQEQGGSVPDQGLEQRSPFRRRRRLDARDFLEPSRRDCIGRWHVGVGRRVRERRPAPMVGRFGVGGEGVGNGLIRLGASGVCGRAMRAVGRRGALLRLGQIESIAPVRIGQGTEHLKPSPTTQRVEVLQRLVPGEHARIFGKKERRNGVARSPVAADEGAEEHQVLAHLVAVEPREIEPERLVQAMQRRALPVDQGAHVIRFRGTADRERKRQALVAGESRDGVDRAGQAIGEGARRIEGKPSARHPGDRQPRVRVASRLSVAPVDEQGRGAAFLAAGHLRAEPKDDRTSVVVRHLDPLRALEEQGHGHPACASGRRVHIPNQVHQRAAALANGVPQRE